MKRGIRRGIPSTDCLVIFETAARYLNFTRAATELGLTQGAVSRQILDLEAFLETPLFDRSRRTLSLTDTGRDYLDAIRPLLNALESATLNALAARTLRQAVNLSVAASFCNRWLIPRLPDFLARHPGALINVSPRVGRIDFDTSQFDGAVINAAAPPPGVSAMKLFPVRLAPYAAPKLLQSAPPLTVAQLCALPLLHLHESPDAWSVYLKLMHAGRRPVPDGPQNSLLLVNCEAALAGLGVALLPPEFVESDVRDGRLVKVAHPTLESAFSYWLIWRESRKDRMESILAWLGGLFGTSPI
ncbi:hypothetical protein WJ58_16625 [Burkholderia ubonensis]|uniref:LysR substrate-binding domain-containing protein n=1 Tax=Burkholderia ubonensis TaxID=101571 RepID=UPI0007594CB0|nr:LysR substrate-binding domain-containing protein [Burkholderia ubonensis]KVM54710.1 hypothetical protein WJ58_16625 [Burkholderia ubonensis]